VIGNADAAAATLEGVDEGFEVGDPVLCGGDLTRQAGSIGFQIVHVSVPPSGFVHGT